MVGFKNVSASGFDLVCGAKTSNLIKKFGLSGKILFARVLGGCDIWAHNLAASVTVLQEL
jgi:hypothetical protein